jgi:zinc D-Ala-D-Ala carboxypeptidase
MNLEFFTLEEFNCQVTGENKMEPEFLQKLDRLRGECGFPFVITSGYRHPIEHPIEAAKEVPGTHAQGIAADILVQDSVSRMVLVEKALELGFKGVGIAKTFVHVDTRGTTPVMWLY